MVHVVTDACVKCMACTKICPVSCIHPMEDEPALADVEQVYINPNECINCGQCAPICPVEAIFQEDELPGGKRQAAQVNADFFKIIH